LVPSQRVHTQRVIRKRALSIFPSWLRVQMYIPS
jgi:hypothetical protein